MIPKSNAPQETLFSRQVEQQSATVGYFKRRMMRTAFGLGFGLVYLLFSTLFGGLSNVDEGKTSYGNKNSSKSTSSMFWGGSAKKKNSGYKRYLD